MAIQEINTNIETNYFMLLSFILIFQFLFNQYLNSRQYKKLQNKELPDKLKPFNITKEQFLKSNSYTLDKISFSIKKNTFKTIVELLFLYFFYHSYIWNITGNIIKYYEYEDSEYKRIPILMIIETLTSTIIDIPFSYYFDFVIDEKHGFNKKTIALFIKDTLISIVLSLVLGIPIFMGLIYILEIGGDYFYIYVEIFIIIISIFLITIYPHAIAPLFNKFTELEDGSLKDKIKELAKNMDFPLTKIFIVDGSKRSSHSNAYFFGLGKNKRIVLYDTLISHLKDEEIIAVLCHELGHWKENHMIKMMLCSFTQLLIMFYLFGFFINNNDLFLSLGFKEKSLVIGLYLYMNIYSPISYILGLVTLVISRKHEFDADTFAVTLGYGKKLGESLLKLFDENSGDLDPDELYAACHFSHPTFIERLCIITKMSEEKEKMN